MNAFLMTYRPLTILRVVGLALVLTVAARFAHAQQPIRGVPASLDDAEAVLANPALISFHRSKVTLGVKGYHLGLDDAGRVPLRQGFLSFSTPFVIGDRVGMGSSVQYFDSPIFKRTQLGASVSGRVFRFISLGVRAAALNMSYNRDNFVGVEPGDPVFEGGTATTTFTTSVGAFAQPLADLGVAVGMRHLNSPDLSLVGAGATEEPAFFAGVSYALGSVRANWSINDGRQGIQNRFSMDVYSTDGSFLRVGSNVGLTSPQVEGQLHVGGPISVSYEYGLPSTDLLGTSTGSHQFTLVYEIGRTPDLPPPVSPPPLRLEADAEVPSSFLPPKVHLTTDDPFLQVLEKNIERRIDEQVPRGALRTLSPRDLGMIDSTLALSDHRDSSRAFASPPPTIRLTDPLSDTYSQTLRSLERWLARDSARSIALRGTGEQVVKAVGVRNRLLAAHRVQPSQLRVDTLASDSTRLNLDTMRPRETLVVLNPARTVVHVLEAYLDDDVRSWQLKVHRRGGDVVKTFGGTGALPSRITWDWSTDEGRPLDAGVFGYQLTWTGADGKKGRSNRGLLYVRKSVRRITFRVTQDPEVLNEPADQVELRLQRE